MSKVKLVFGYHASRRLYDADKGFPFGNADGLPWPHNSDDMGMFMEDTRDSVLVMGSKTWESLPKRLKNRVNVVLSSGTPRNKAGEMPDHLVVGDIGDVILGLKETYPNCDICIIGGLSVLTAAAEYADELYDTRIEMRKHSDITTDLWMSHQQMYDIIKGFEPTKSQTFYYRNDSKFKSVIRTISTRK